MAHATLVCGLPRKGSNRPCAGTVFVFWPAQQLWEKVRPLGVGEPTSPGHNACFCSGCGRKWEVRPISIPAVDDAA